MGSVDGFSQPPGKNQQKNPTKNSEEPLKGMRWLYEDDDDFERAQKKTAAEVSREELKKQLAKKARADQAKKLTAKLAGGLKKALSAIYKTLRAVFSPRHRKKALIAAPILVAAIISAYIFIPKNPEARVLGDDLPNSPTYDTLIPNNSIESTTSGQIAYNKQKQLTSYTDEIGSIQATISQQPLPEKFKKDPFGELEKLAHEIGASEKLQTGTTTAYVGLSGEDTQTAVFIKNQVLVFITAAKEFDVLELFTYIDSLQ
jgi:hypothetical protein